MKSMVHSGRKMEPRKLILESMNIDKKTRWLEVTSTAMYDAENNFIGFSGICQDITKKNEIEQIIAGKQAIARKKRTSPQRSY